MSQAKRPPFSKIEPHLGPEPSPDTAPELRRAPSDAEIRAAVKELRRRLGLSQVEFASKVGKSYPMIQRYEQKKAPIGRAVRAFLDLARSKEYHDLVELFELGMLRGIVESEGLEEFVSRDALKAILGSPVHLMELTGEPLKQWEWYLLAEFLTFIRHVHPEKIMAIWKEITAGLDEALEEPRSVDFFEYFRAKGELTEEQLSTWGDAVTEEELKEWRNEKARTWGRNRISKKK